MAKGARSRDAVCPFYKSDTDRQIKCEGYMEGMTSVALNYALPAYTTYHVSKLCCKDYRQCEIYQLIQRERYCNDH